MDAMIGVVVLIVCLIVGFALVLWLIVYRKRIFNRKKGTVAKIKPAFSLGGNFVEDLTVPIETKYEVTTNVLGSGSSAQVVIGENRRSKRKYAIKVIDLSRHEVAWRYEREKNFLRDIDHTNVVRLYEVYSAPSALYFVMELCTGGHLGQVLRASPEGRLDEDVAMEFIKQLTRAISHCHHHGICHRDVKLQNILLESSSNEAQIKLVDFGNGARFRNNLPLTKVVGTTYTAAPEVFKECYDERCDVWSLGVVTYILLSGRRPFEKMEVPISRPTAGNKGTTVTRKEESVVASILLGKYHFNHEVWDEISNDAINFIKHCFVMDYTRRNSAQTMLEHPWLLDSTELFPHHDGIRKLSFNSTDTLRKTLGRELNSPFSGIRHISMLAVAFARPTDKVQMLRKVFQEIDYDGSGTIERGEFMTAMKLINPDLTLFQANTLFERIDQDENHCISFIEFLAATLDPREVDLREIKQAFRLIDRENKGYISREDVWRILGTTRVEEFEQIHDTRTTSNNNSHSQSHHGDAQPQIVGNAALAATHPHNTNHSPSPVPTNPTNNNSNNHHSTANAALQLGTALSAVVGRTLSANNSGRTQPSSDDVTDQRNRKLELRIDDIMEQADLNNDGVISYNEFLYAISGGDLSHSIISGGPHSHHGSHSPQPQDNSHLLLENLRIAPPILPLDQQHDGSFVASLKKRISEGNVLFLNNNHQREKSFPAPRTKPTPSSLHSRSWYNPFPRSFSLLRKANINGGKYSAGGQSSNAVHPTATHPGNTSAAWIEESMNSYSHHSHHSQPSHHSQGQQGHTSQLADFSKGIAEIFHRRHSSHSSISPSMHAQQAQPNGPNSANNANTNDRSGSLLGAAPSNGKDISIVSHFVQPELSLPNHIDNHLNNTTNNTNNINNALPARHTSLVEDIETGHEVLHKLNAMQLNASLSQSSKGPSWIERPTPPGSFLVDRFSTGLLANTNSLLSHTAAGGLLSSWSGKQKPKASDGANTDVDIEAVIAKLEIGDRSRHSDLRMNYDDPGVLILSDKTKPQQENNTTTSASAATTLIRKASRSPRSFHAPHTHTGAHAVHTVHAVRELDSAEYSAVEYGSSKQLSDRALVDLEAGNDSQGNVCSY